MKMAKRLISVVLVVLMLLSMSVVAASAYTVPDGFEVTDKEATEINGQVYGRIGDTDMNDTVNVRDATLIQKSAADLADLDDVQKILADVNFDGKVNVRDATAVQKWVADLEIEFPINQLIYIPEVTEPETTAPTEPETTAPTEPETTAPVETEPEATTPDETEPAETEPAETEPVETEPVETEPVETEPAATTPDETEPVETEPVETEPVETEPVETEPAETEPEVETITIYFSNNNGWENVYIYGFYGVEGSEATGEPLGAYPGTKMTFVEKNGFGQDIYSAEVPADIDYIKFTDGTASNNRTNNIPKTEIADNAGFYITDNLGGTKWGYGTYEYIPSEPETTAPVETEPVETEPEATTPDETEPAETEPAATTPDETEPVETESEVETITIYFSNNNGWENVYIYGFYGVEGSEATGEPLGAYPGTKMTFVEKNGYGQDIYSAEVPADIDYIKFADGTASNNRTNNIPKTEIADNAGFYITDNLGGTKWGYGTYEYAPSEPETTAPVETEPVETEPEATTPDETEPVETEPAETEPAATTPDETEPVETEPVETEPEVETITIYFSNNNGWENVYIYGFYGVEGGEATGEPLGAYPGTKMTFVEKNGYGQDIYSAEVPADIDYIKFADGTATNNRTNNIPKTEIADNAGFYITDNLGGTKWGYGTYEYAPSEPETTAPVETEPVETEPVETEPVETEPAETEPVETEPEATTPDETEPVETEPVETEPVETEPVETEPEKNTITIYFSNNNGWENVYIYGFYGVEGGEATGEPLGAYPGTKMTFVEKNGYGQDIYGAEVPADIDYIKFADGTASNNRTNNIPKTEIADNAGFYITDNLGGTKWGYGTYEYAPSVPEDTTAPVETEPVVTEPVETEPVETEPADPEPAGVTVYAVNSAKWDTVCAYYWGGADVAWPGTAMTKTGDTVNGFDVYSITLDKAPENIIFNNNNNGSQTGDLTFQAGQYFDVKSGKWYASLKDIPEVSKLSTDRYLVGSFNNWSTTANEFTISAEGETVAYVELELEANTTYEFKIVREGKWTSCKTTLNITDSAEGLTFSSSVSDNTKLVTKAAGTYVFAFGLETSQLSVTYPK